MSTQHVCQAGGGGKESIVTSTARAEKYLAKVSRCPHARSMNGYTSNHLKGKSVFFSSWHIMKLKTNGV